jgi:hypothetical protein
MRDNNWYKVLDQINTENALAEDVRQFNENLEFQTTKAELDREFQAKQAEIDRQFKEAQAALDRQHDFKLQEAKTKAEKELLDKQHKQNMEKLAQQHTNDLAVLEKKYEISKRDSGTTFGNSSAGRGIVASAKIAASSAKAATTKTQKTKSFTGSTYKEAVAFLKSIGWGNASGIMTMSEWSRRKNAGSTAVEVKNYKTYQAYLKSYCQYAVEQTYGK